MERDFLSTTTKYNKLEKRHNALPFIFICALLSIFCILKVLRGADTESTQSGGIWNVISLLFYPILFFAVFSHNVYRLKMVFIAPLAYSFWALAVSLLHVNGTLTLAYAYQLLMIPYFFLIFSSFYLINKPSKFGETILLFTYFACLLLNLINVFKSRFLGTEEAMASDVYFSLCTFPFVLQIMKNKKIKGALFVLQFIAIFLADKRTGIISFLIATIVYLFLSSYKSKLKLLKTLILVAICMWGLYLLTSYLDNLYNLRIYERLFGLSEDGGSGRDEIYLKIWEAFKESSFLDKFIGHGVNSVSFAGAEHAHNDFLEILYCYGIVSIVLIVCFYTALIVEAIKMIRRHSPYAPAFTFSVIIGIFLSMFSYFLIFFTYVSCLVAFWGYSLAKENSRLFRKRRDQ